MQEKFFEDSILLGHHLTQPSGGNLWFFIQAIFDFSFMQSLIFHRVNLWFFSQSIFDFSFMQSLIESSLTARTRDNENSLTARTRWQRELVDCENSLTAQPRWWRELVDGENSLTAGTRWRREVVDSENSLTARTRCSENSLQRELVAARTRWRRELVDNENSLQRGPADRENSPTEKPRCCENSLTPWQYRDWFRRSPYKSLEIRSLSEAIFENLLQNLWKCKKNSLKIQSYSDSILLSRVEAIFDFLFRQSLIFHSGNLWFFTESIFDFSVSQSLIFHSCNLWFSSMQSLSENWTKIEHEKSQT